MRRARRGPPPVILQACLGPSTTQLPAPAAACGRRPTRASPGTRSWMSPRMSCWRAKPTALVSINQCALPIHPQLDLGLHVGSVDRGHLSKKLVTGPGQAGTGTRGLIRTRPALSPPSPVGTAWTAPNPVRKGWGARIRMWGLTPLRPPPLLRGIWGWMVPGQMPPSLAPGLPPLPAPLRHEDRSVCQQRRGKLFLSELSQGQRGRRCCEMLSWGLTILRNPALFLRMKSL